MRNGGDWTVSELLIGKTLIKTSPNFPSLYYLQMEDAYHFLPHEKWSIIIPFIRQHFFNLYGIGIEISATKMPVAQIIKIYPNSPASLSNKLRLGDAILAISPNNDETWIDVRMLPTQRIVSLILGKKRESFRLCVLHLDGTNEEIVIER